MINKANYFFTSVWKQFTRKGFSCPSCGGADSTVVSRKYFVTALRRCRDCQLLFRTPTTNADENKVFYQQKYSQGFTTDCPTEEMLAKLLHEGFAGKEKDYTTYIDILRAVGGKKGDRLFDFGCSWGYGSWQLSQKGYNVDAYEISIPRAAFAREKLGVKVFSSLQEVNSFYEIFFSSHVLEHVPSVSEVVKFGMDILKPGGIFIAFTPNGSAEYRRRDGKIWNQLWGSVHPNFLDEQFYLNTFPDSDLFISSNPYPLVEIEKWGTPNRILKHLYGEELLVLVRK